jgi:methionine-rich copper-binding protein CopC
MGRTAVLVLVLLLLPAGGLLAHAELQTAVPAPGESLREQPEEIRLTFNEAVGPGSSITIFGVGFEEISGTAAKVDEDNVNQLVTAVPRLEPATYSVQWLEISLDGHPASGSYSFGVSAEAARKGVVNSGLILVVGLGMVVVIGSGAFIFSRRNRKGS